MEDMGTILAKPPVEFWPDVRWWLAEGFHTEETLKKDIAMLYEAGFGAAEFLAMDEHGIDHGKYGWGSEEWTHDTHTVIRETTARGMGASFTSGTNWSNANLITIKPDDRAAAKELDFTAESLKDRESRSGPLQKASLKMPNVNVQELVAVVAAKKTGAANGRVFLDKDSVQLLTGKVRGETLDWAAPGGEWELFTFWLHGTGQTATPSAAVSYTVNYIDRYGIDALMGYWDREVLMPELRENIRKNGRVQMYMDSLELSTHGKGGQFWGYHFIEEFKNRRGYDLSSYLPFIIRKDTYMGGPFTYRYRYEPDPASPEGVRFIGKLRNDLYQTMTELYIDNMLKPMQRWLHTVGMELRAEISYGMPFEISIPGKYVDGIETESLEFASQIEPYRNLAGPVHLFGKLYSSETGATMMNYQMGLDFYTQIVYTQFAAGVARTVFHGYSSIAGSEGATYWPGHEGMWPLFSERFGCRQPAYQHYNDWTGMIARYQYLLRQGKPRVDLGILRLDYNFNNLYIALGNEKKLYKNSLMRDNKGIYWQDPGLQNRGWTYDYFAPQILEDESIRFSEGLLAPEGPGYRALIIYQEEMPLSSARRILQWAQEGLPVILVNGVTEQIRLQVSKTHVKAASVTPFNGESDEELARVIGELKKLPNVKEIENQAETPGVLEKDLGIKPRAAFGVPNKNILTCLREDGEKRYLFVYNYLYTRKEPFAVEISLEGEGSPWRIDCWTGKIERIGAYRVEEGRTTVGLSLMPGEAAMIVLDCSGKGAFHAVDAEGCEVLILDGKPVLKTQKSGGYTIKFSDGREAGAEVTVPAPVEIRHWDLEVEDWNEGDQKEIIEDRGLGLVTREVYFETKKTLIPVGKTELKPWKDIPGLGPEVSGVGYYRAAFTLPADWGTDKGALLHIGSTNGNSAAVYVNGAKAPAYDFNRKAVDITALVQPGENTLTVEVSSTLNNRLLARGYHTIIRKVLQARVDNFPKPEDAEAGLSPDMLKFTTPNVQDYGLAGPVTVSFYTLAPLTSL
ncbi:MAG: hypothetical protein LBF74_14285 [Treponema sp.]|jgi:hypothetical protein|nr:hypothetical protein [Treponema sp.]